MGDEKNANGTSEDLFSSWVKAAGDFWGAMFQAWSGKGDPASFQNKNEKVDTGSAQASMASVLKSFQAASSVFSEPKAVESFFQSSGAMPDILAKMAQSAVSGFLQFQQKWIERAGRIGQTAEAYKFEDLDQNLFRAWAEIYQTEFRQFFNIPQLGLTRFYQEKMNRVMDRFNIFQSMFAEFLRLLHLPITRSYAVMQEELRRMVEDGQAPEDTKAYYRMWIKILEGHYMTLFQSPEYVETLGKTLDAMSEFTESKDQVLEDMLSTMPVPKQSEMDELYKDLHLLKKRVKALEKKIGE